jgi:hypothetical protein
MEGMTECLLAWLQADQEKIVATKKPIKNRRNPKEKANKKTVEAKMDCFTSRMYVNQAKTENILAKNWW